MNNFCFAGCYGQALGKDRMAPESKSHRCPIKISFGRWGLGVMCLIIAASWSELTFHPATGQDESGISGGFLLDVLGKACSFFRWNVLKCYKL